MSLRGNIWDNFTTGEGEIINHHRLRFVDDFKVCFRNWNERRRLIIVRGDDDKVGRALSEATDNYRCELAVRNINLSEYFTWKLRTIREATKYVI